MTNGAFEPPISSVSGFDADSHGGTQIRGVGLSDQAKWEVTKLEAFGYSQEGCLIGDGKHNGVGTGWDTAVRRRFAGGVNELGSGYADREVGAHHAAVDQMIRCGGRIRTCDLLEAIQA